MQALILIFSGIVITVFFIYNFFSAFRKMKPPANYQKTQGRIILVKGNQTHLISKLDKLWQIEVSYEFVAGDERLNSKWFGPVEGLKEKVLRNEPVDVYYNPEDPEESVLQGKVPPIVIAFNVAGCVFGVLMTVAGFIVTE